MHGDGFNVGDSSGKASSMGTRKVLQEVFLIANRYELVKEYDFFLKKEANENG
jgi:hypothetical protein